MLLFYIFSFFLFHLNLLSTNNSNISNFKTFKNDPFNTHYCQLDNGLNLYLVKNCEDAYITINIIYHVGSINDPENNTGLAHFLEHLLFNGTTKIGTLNYKKEEVILNKIKKLFDKLSSVKSEKERNNLLNKIKKLTSKASKYAIYRELENILRSYGCRNINATTSDENTVFRLEIPKNSLAVVFELLFNQFDEPIFRNFYNEFTVICNEYIKCRDSLDNLIINKAKKALFKKKYRNSVIGSRKDLKNISISAVENFYKKYYVPNNCTIFLIGDLDYNESLSIIKKTFGRFKKKDINDTIIKEKVLLNNQEIDIISEHQQCIFDLYKVNVNEENYMGMLFTVNILNKCLKDFCQNPKYVDSCDFSCYFLRDHKFVYLSVFNKDKQSIGEAKDTIFNFIQDINTCVEIDKIISSFIMEEKYLIRNFKSNKDKFELKIVKVLENGFDYQLYLDNYIKSLSNFNKTQFLYTVNKIFSANRLRINKYVGHRKKIDDLHIDSVDIELNSDKKSDYRKEIEKIELKPIVPEFVNYKKFKTIYYPKNENIKIKYIKNDERIFNIQIIFDYLMFQDKLLFELSWFDSLKCKNMTFYQLINELASFGVYLMLGAYSTGFRIRIYGLSESFEKAIKLLFYFFNNATVNYKQLDGIKKRMLYNLKSKSFDFDKLLFDKKIFLNVNDIVNLSPESIKKCISNIFSSQFEIFICSDVDSSEIIRILERNNVLKQNTVQHKKECIKLNNFKNNKIYIVDSCAAENITVDLYIPFDFYKNDSFYHLNLHFLNKYIFKLLYNKLRSNGGVYYIDTYLDFQSTIRNGCLRVSFKSSKELFDKNFVSIYNEINNLVRNDILFNEVLENIIKQVFFDKFSNSAIVNTYIYHKYNFGLLSEESNFHNFLINNYKNFSFDNMYKIYTDIVKNRNMIICVSGNVDYIDFNVLAKYGNIEFI